jgi:hypothetical protein
MKKILKWVAIVVGSLTVLAFLAFLYFIPPFELAPPEEFSKPEATAPPSLDDIKDPAEKLLAERGRYIVVRSGCTGCHTPLGDQGPEFSLYLSGGGKGVEKGKGTFVTRNLTPDPETGIGKRTDDEIKMALRSGVFHDGRLMPARAMPWSAWSNWTEEDRHAVVVFLRHLKPVWHRIPDMSPAGEMIDTAAVEEDFGADFGQKQ